MLSVTAPGPQHADPRQPLYRWYHAAIFAVLVELPAIAVPWREHLFDGFRIPPLRPPGAIFPLVWAVIVLCMLIAGLRILNRPGLPRRDLHLALHATYWLAYVAFPIAYFGLSSPWLGAILTLLIMGVALMECRLLWPADRAAALLMLPLCAWSLFAGLYLSTWQALYNPDPLLRLQAMLP